MHIDAKREWDQQLARDCPSGSHTHGYLGPARGDDADRRQRNKQRDRFVMAIDRVAVAQTVPAERG
jgi:hypothetical protein